MTIVVAGFTFMQSCRMSSHVRHASARSEHCTQNTVKVLTIQEVIVCLSTWDTYSMFALRVGQYASVLLFFFHLILCATEGLQLVVPFWHCLFQLPRHVKVCLL